MPRGVPNTKPETTETEAPTARPTVRRPISDAMAAFRAKAAAQAERLPSVTIRLDEGQYLSGMVRNKGTSYTEFGELPVVEFHPGTWETDTPVTYSPNDGEGLRVEDVPADHSAVYVGVGTVAAQLVDALPGDLLYIIRHPDQISQGNGRPYTVIEILCERNGVMLSLKEHARIAREAAEAERAARVVGTVFPGTVAVNPNEEPF